MAKKRLLTLVIGVLTATAVVVAQPARIRAINFTTRDGLGSNVVNCVVQDRQGYLWFGTNHCLTRFDGHRFVNFYVEADGERQIEGITHIVEDTTRNVLLMSGKDYRLLCFDLVQMRFVNAEGMTFPEADNDAEEAAFIARARELGIQRGNITNRRHDMHYVRLADGREIFTTIDNGLYIYDPIVGKLQHLCSADDNPVIESDYINDAILDRSGSIWLATTFAGIYQLDLDEGALRYHALEGSSGNIRSFSQFSDGTIAVGDMDGYIFRYDTQTGKSKLICQKGHRAYAMRTDSHGRFWVGTRGGGVWVDDRHLNATDDFQLVRSSIYVLLRTILHGLALSTEDSLKQKNSPMVLSLTIPICPTKRYIRYSSTERVAFGLPQRMASSARMARNFILYIINVRWCVLLKALPTPSMLVATVMDY